MDKLAQAIAILKAGRSFQEASDVSGISIKKIIAAWEMVKV